MAKIKKAPFSNGMTEPEVVAYLKLQRPDYVDENGVKHHTKPRWSDDDLILRNQLIIYWLTSEGLSRIEVVQKLMSVFSISRSNAFLWSGEALKSLNDGFDEYRDMARQMQIEKIEKLIKECKGLGKYKEAAMLNEQLNKIYGLYTENKKVEVKSEEPIRFKFDKD